MYDPATKRGVLSDFDLAREGGPNRRPNAKDNTGTLPFLALDLLDEKAFEGLVPRRYRHDAESFAWCLIYICICAGKDEGGRIGTINPHPLLSWFETIAGSYYSKTRLALTKLLEEFPLHKRTKPLALALHDYWTMRFYGQMSSVYKPYKELSDHESFKEVFTKILSTHKRNVVPETKGDIFNESVELVITSYPYVASS